MVLELARVPWTHKISERKHLLIRFHVLVFILFQFLLPTFNIHIKYQ